MKIKKDRDTVQHAFIKLLNDEYNYKQPIDMDLGELIGDLEDNDYEGNEWIWDIDKECIITLPNLEHYAVIVAELSIKNYVKLIQRFYPFKNAARSQTQTTRMMLFLSHQKNDKMLFYFRNINLQSHG